MCTSPAAVLCYKRPTDRKWNTRYVGNVMRDELSDSSLILDELCLRSKGFDTKLDVVACQQCFECRMQRSRAWADRCSIEAEQYPDHGSIVNNWFLTLTYNNDNVGDLWNDDRTVLSLHNPNKERFAILKQLKNRGGLIDCVIDEWNTGLLSEEKRNSILSGIELPDLPKNKKDHLQVYNDSLRTHFARKFGHKGIRFFACGEYGDNNFRPHYHEILFNMPIDVKDENLVIKFGCNPLGHQYYRVPFLEKIWKRGFVILAPASWESMAYTARYIVKKQNGDSGLELYDGNGIKPPFVRESRKPGIGMQGYKGVETYFNFSDSDTEFIIDKDSGEFIGETTPDNYFLTDKVFFKNACHGVSDFSVPRAYDKRFEFEHPYLMDIVKRLRKERSDIAYDTKKYVTQLSDRELFDIREDMHNKSISGKQRCFIQDFC